MRSERRRPRRAFAAVAAAALLLVAGSAAGESESGAAWPTADEVLGLDSPLGRISYHLGRGLRVGDTGFTIGGFTTAEGERLEDGESRASLEGVNFFFIYDPAPPLHVFAEIEVVDLAEWTSTLRELEDGADEGGEVEAGEEEPEEGEEVSETKAQELRRRARRDRFRSEPSIDVDRVYLDARASDALNVRFGKFLTPFGRWNPAPIEPLVWTTSEPLIVEDVFDEVVSGAMVQGSVFPRGGALSYSLYGTFLKPLEPDPDAPPADHAAGAYLEWASLDGWSFGASYFASEPRRGGSWNHFGGVDFLWRPWQRLELSSEIAAGEGPRDDGLLYGLYAQAVVETVPTLYAVGRYERLDPPGRGAAVDLFDLGLAWAPVSWIRLKGDYLLADHSGELAAPGFRSSFSVLF